MSNPFKKYIDNEFYRNVFTLISATSLAQALAILIYPVLTRIYTIEEHGLFGLYMSIISITTIISTGKYELSVLLSKRHIRAANLLFLSVLLSAVFSLLLVILIVLFGRSFASALGNAKIYSWLYFAPLSTFLIALFQSLSYWSNRHKRYQKMAFANMWQSLTNSVIKISSSGIFSNAGGLIIGAIVGQIAGALTFVLDFFRKDKNMLSEISKDEILSAGKEYILFPKFSMLHHLMNNFSGSLPIFALSSWFSTENSGLYSVAYIIISRPMSLLTSALGQVFSQRVIANYNEGKAIIGDVKRLVIRLIQIGIIPFILAAIAGPVLFSIILGEDWQESGRYMQILLPWLFVVLISSPLSFIPDMLNLQKKAMWIDMVKLIFRLLAVATGIYFSDIYILLIGFSISSMLVNLYSFFWYIRLAGNANKIKPATSINKPEISITDAPNI